MFNFPSRDEAISLPEQCKIFYVDNSRDYFTLIENRDGGGIDVEVFLIDETIIFQPSLQKLNFMPKCFSDNYGIDELI